MPWLGIRGNGTLSHALPRKFRLDLMGWNVLQNEFTVDSGEVTGAKFYGSLWDTTFYGEFGINSELHFGATYFKLGDMVNWGVDLMIEGDHGYRAAHITSAPPSGVPEPGSILLLGTA